MPSSPLIEDSAYSDAPSPSPGGGVIHAFIGGKPITQGSMKHIGNGMMTAANPKLKGWRAEVRKALETAKPVTWELAGPMEMSVDFLFARPVAHFRLNGLLKPSAPIMPCLRSCGDLDKLVRAIMDAGTGVAYDDDSQVVTINTRKRYCKSAEGRPIQRPGAYVVLKRLRIT